MGDDPTVTAFVSGTPEILHTMYAEAPPLQRQVQHLLLPALITIIKMMEDVVRTTVGQAILEHVMTAEMIGRLPQVESRNQLLRHHLQPLRSQPWLQLLPHCDVSLLIRQFVAVELVADR